MKTLAEIIAKLPFNCHECGEPEREIVMQACLKALSEAPLEFDEKAAEYDAAFYCSAHPNERRSHYYVEGRKDQFAQSALTVNALKAENEQLKSQRLPDYLHEVVRADNDRVNNELKEMVKQLAAKDAEIERWHKDSDAQEHFFHKREVVLKTTIADQRELLRNAKIILENYRQGESDDGEYNNEEVIDMVEVITKHLAATTSGAKGATNE